MHTQQVQDNLWPLLGTQQGICVVHKGYCNVAVQLDS